MYSNFMHTLLTFYKVVLDNCKACRGLPDLATNNVHAKWIPAIEITLKEAGEWNGLSTNGLKYLNDYYMTRDDNHHSNYKFCSPCENLLSPFNNCAAILL